MRFVFLSMSYTLCLNLSLSSYMSVGLPVGLLVCSCLNFALLKDLLLEFCVNTEPRTCRKLSQLLDFGLTSDNRVSQMG